MNKPTSSTSILEASSSFSRRDFLRVGAVSTAAVFTESAPFRFVEAAFHQPVDTTLTGKIAVLIPQQGPGAAAYTAFARVFAAQYPRVDLMTAPVRPYWGDVVEASRILSNDHQARIIVTLMNPVLSGLAHDYFASADSLLIVASAGENMLRHEDRLANVFHTSLHLWESNYALGRWAAQTRGRRGSIVTSLYDSGYDALHAFQMGVEAAGGEIISTVVQPNHKTDERFEALKQTLIAHPADFIFQMRGSRPQVDTALLMLAQELEVPLLTSPANILSADYSRLGAETAVLAATSLAAAQAHHGDLSAPANALRRLSAVHPTYQTLSAAVVNPLSDADCDCAIEQISAASLRTGWSTPYLMI